MRRGNVVAVGSLVAALGTGTVTYNLLKPEQREAQLTRSTTAPFSRAAFGSGWVDVDKNGCDTRNDILQRDLSNVRLDDSGCKVTTGVLRKDPYGALTNLPPKAVDIDHMIPLQYVWTHGGEFWPKELRVKYANDPDVLFAVSASANRAKGAKGPAAWKPDRHAYCFYAAAWERIARMYPINVAEVDLKAMNEMTKDC